MRKFLIISAAAVLPVLTATALVAHGREGHGPDDRRAAAATSPTTATTSASTTTSVPVTSTSVPATAPVVPRRAAPATTTVAPRPAAARYVCPDGGIDAVVELQRAYAAGHQPWRGSAADVAAACTFGMPDATVEAAGPHRFRVTQAGTSRRVLVEVAQPLGPTTIWVVTRVTAA
jgi:hypothetical protein